MAIDAVTLSNNINNMMKSVQFSGKSDKNISDAISMGLFTYLKTPNLISFQLSGTAGPIGSVTSITYVGIVPSVMSNLIRFKAPFTGKSWKNMCDAISNGIAMTFQTSSISGTTVGIALGGGIGRFSNMVTSDLVNRIKATASFKSILGSKKDQLVDAVAFGICTHFKTSVTVTATVTGAIAPTPPTGPVAVTAMPTVYNIII